MTEKMTQGAYFQYPSDETITSNTKQALSSIMLRSLTSAKENGLLGVQLPKLEFTIGDSGMSIETKITQLKEPVAQANVPESGLTQVFVRCSDKHVTELRFMSGHNQISRVTTKVQVKDGVTNFAKVPSDHTVIGYYGYLDTDGAVQALGLLLICRKGD